MEYLESFKINNQQKVPKLEHKIELIEEILKVAVDKTKSEGLSVDVFDDTITQCFAIFEEEDFNPSEYAKGIFDNIDLLKFKKLTKKFKEHFCAFLNTEVNSSTNLIEYIDSTGINIVIETFLSVFGVGDEIKPAYEMATNLACSLIKLGYNNWCLPPVKEKKE